jgi:hypothetical protein
VGDLTPVLAEELRVAAAPGVVGLGLEDDPSRLFNSSLEGNKRRAIDVREGETLDAEAFKALIRAAVAENLRSGAKKAKSPPKPRAKAKPSDEK